MSPNETDISMRENMYPSVLIPNVDEDNHIDLQYESDSSEEATYINDPVHGMLEIHPLCKAVIDTPEFQRLRFIKQCGISCFVYPSATHTRLDHSLGVCFLALKVVKKLNEMREHAVSPEESLCIQLAGLCHDLGHGPFSHFWESFVKFHHEDMSVKIFDYLIKKNNLQEKFTKYGLNSEYIQFIKDLIQGKPSHYESITPKSYLFEIVNNQLNGLDIDKFEYLLKDSYFFGISITTYFDRFLTCLLIVKDSKGVEHIGFKTKLQASILNVFKDRAILHNVGYQHRVCKNIETMLLDALIIADEHIEISVDNPADRKYKLSECHENVEAMLKLTDHLFERILYSRNEKLKNAKDILIRILKRKLYVEIYETNLDGIKVNQSEFDRVLKTIGDRYNVQLHCRIKTLGLGQNDNECDPLKNVLFVDRSGQLDASLERDPSLWLPKQTTCKKLFVFCKSNVKEEIKREVAAVITKEKAKLMEK